MQNIECVLKSRIKADSAETFVVIVPTNAARLKRQRELLRYHPSGTVANLRVHTLAKFVQRLYAQLDRNEKRVTISPGLQTLWLREIVDGQKQQSFSPAQDVPVPDSTLSLIVNSINYLKERGTDDTEWKGLASDARNTSNPHLTALTEVYGEYQDKLTPRWIDEKGMHLFLATLFNPRLMENAFPGVTLVSVEDFDLLSKADIKLLAQIADMPNMQVYFRADYRKGNPALFGHVENLFKELRDSKVITEELLPPRSERIAHFAQNLFQSHSDASSRLKLHEKIKLVRPADRMDEVEQVAHLIRQRIKSGACQPDDICVTYHNPEPYLQRIAEVFPEHGIPYSVTEGHPLAHSPLVKAIFSCLRENAVPIEPPYFSGVEVPPREREMTPAVFQTYFNELLEQGEVLSNILNSPDVIPNAVVSSEIAAYQAIKKLVDELRRSFDAPAETTHHYYQYVQWLRLMAAHTTYRTPETSGGVRILNLSQIQSLDFDTVILGDFTDGRFPISYRPDALLPETHVRSQSDQECEQRFLFYMTLKAFRERLYLISPQRENQSDLGPSPFLAQLKQVAKIGTEEVETTGEFSHVSFLRKYGQYVWETEAPETDFVDARWPRTMPLVNHVARVEKSREETHNRLAYEGILTARSRSALAEQRIKPHSVTELETYARCPFQYFAGRILELGAPRDDEEGLSALEKGILIHQMLFEFYTNRNGQQPNAANFAEAKRQLDEVIERATEEHRHYLSGKQETAIGSDNIFWQIEKERLQIALHRWLEAERDADLPVLPRYFEVNIGGKKRGNADAELSRAEAIPIGDVLLQAKIDRIDVGEGVFNVIDYKTGSSTIRIRDILEGRALQLPIYLEIAKQLLQGEYRPAAGLYHKIRFDTCTVELGVGNKDDNGTNFQGYNGEVWNKVGGRSGRSGQLVEPLPPVIQRVIGYVAHYVDEMCDGKFPLITRVKTFVDAVEDGSFPLTPRNKTAPCSYCAYKQMCRVGAVPETTDADA